MPQYLVAIHHPENYDSSGEGESMMQDIDALNEEMQAAGARFFAGGLSETAVRSLRAQPDGTVSISEGPYLQGAEHVGGFWILNAASLDEALEWGRKAVIACRAPVEVRAFL